MEIYGQIRFGVTYGMRGFFAIMYDDGGPINSGMGSYADSQGAAREAYEWAIAEGMTAEAQRISDEYKLDLVAKRKSDSDHPWQSAYDQFHEIIMPKLEKIGKEIGKRAQEGDETAKKIISLYSMLYKSFDPLTMIQLEEKLKEYEINR